jgi:hypothetical protein
MKKIDSSYYQPTDAQRIELKAHAAGMRGRIRAMRALRDTTSGFTRLQAGAEKAQAEAFRAAPDTDEGRAFLATFTDSGAGELLDVHADIHGGR